MKTTRMKQNDTMMKSKLQNRIHEPVEPCIRVQRPGRILRRSRCRIRRRAVLLLALLLLAGAAAPGAGVSAFASYGAASGASASSSSASSASSSSAAQAEAHEFRVGSREDLVRLAEACALDSWSRGLTVTLEADLDFGGTDLAPIPSFSGIFLGNGHTISGLTLSTDGSNQALFRYVTETGEVHDLKVQGAVAPENGRDYVAGIAGSNAGLIENCSFSGSVSGRNCVGGIVGENTGTVLNCVASGSVDGKRFTGGIAGYSSGLIRDCRNTAEVNISVSEEKLQLADLASSSNGLATGLLNAEDESIISDSGGVVGFSKGIVLNCSNIATVGYPHYGYNVGGIAGRQSGYLSGCRNAGKVYGRKDVGGVVGQMEPYLKLVHTASLADELSALNAYLNNASADIAYLAAEMAALQEDIIDQQLSWLEEEHSGGSIYHADEDIPEGTAGGSGGSISSAEGGSSVSSTGSIVSAEDIEALADGEVTEEVIQSLIEAGSDALSELLEERMNVLADELADVYAAFSASGGSLAYDLTMANNQFSRVLLMMADAMNGNAQNDLFRDVSAELGEDVTEGNVTLSQNDADVEGDNNVGGIVGSMGIEYEFDLEDSLVTLVGANGVISNTYNSTCINSRNVNYGKVQGKKDRIGGIVGNEETGAVVHCESYGGTASSEGSYVGGIAGYSDAGIRESYALCTVSGARYVGGIAGQGKTLQDNASVIETSAQGAFVGAVAGWAEMNGENVVSGNRFVHDTLGGVDGISYSGRAEPIDYEELLTLSTVPDSFRSVRYAFYADGVLVKELEIDYGSDLAENRIPTVPAKSGYTGTWSAFETENIRFAREIEAVYTLNRSTLATEDTREDTPQSLLLLEGSFAEDADLQLSPYEGPAPEGTEHMAVESWELQIQNVEDQAGSYTVRYLPPADARNGETVIYLLRDGEWVQVDAEQSGSYLVFPAEGNPIVFSAVSPEAAQSRWIIPAAAGGGAALVLLAALLAGRKRRKKKTRKETDQPLPSSQTDAPEKEDEKL